MRRSLTVKGLVSACTMSALLFVPFGLWSMGIQPPGMARPVVLPPAIAVIRNMSELTTTSVHVSDVIEGENGHYKGRWNIHGEVLLGVDLSKVTYARIEPEKREAVLRLPPPHMIASKVDHERSDEVYVKAVSWVSWAIPISSKQVLRDEVWKQADRKIQRLGQEAVHLERAAAQAERVLQDFFGGVGWKVRFERSG